MGKRAKSPTKLPTADDSSPRNARKIERVAEGRVDIHVADGDQIKRLYNTRTDEAANLLFKSALNALGRNADEYLELMPAMVVEMEPRDAVEAMLVTQMTATHLATTTMSQKVHHAPSPQTVEAYERSMTRLSRTFLAQVDGLKKYRAKAQQVVRVERVEVKDGGQAVVGDVSYHRGEDDESDDTPMNPVGGSEMRRDATPQPSPPGKGASARQLEVGASAVCTVHAVGMPLGLVIQGGCMEGGQWRLFRREVSPEFSKDSCPARWLEARPRPTE